MQSDASPLKIFICYHPGDHVSVDQLKNQVRDNGCTIIPEQVPLEGDERDLDTNNALQVADVVIVCIGPHGCGNNQERELEIANIRRKNTGVPRLISVVLPGGDANHRQFQSYSEPQQKIGYLNSVIDEQATTAELKAAIQQGALNRKLAERVRGKCPYLGLEAFDETHEKEFYGRREDVAKALKLVADAVSPSQTVHKVIGVTGASGSGKSSLIRAGVIPQLRHGQVPGSEQWLIVRFRPAEYDRDPIISLANALTKVCGDKKIFQGLDHQQIAKSITEGPESFCKLLNGLLTRVNSISPAAPPRQIVFFIDQFEELYTSCDRWEPFLKALMHAARPDSQGILVLFTLRADHLHLCLNNSDLRNALEKRQLFLGPLGEEGLRDAILRPATNAGGSVDEILVEQLVQEVLSTPNSLPLLQYTLSQMWVKCVDGCLGYAKYRALGGLSGILNNCADEMYKELSPLQKEICCKVMLALVKTGERMITVRDRKTRNSVLDMVGNTKDAKHVISRLEQFRLITPDRDEQSQEGYIEITHESLIEQWKLFRQWVTENGDQLRYLSRISEDARRWGSEKDGVDKEDLLYRGKRLRSVLEWQRSQQVTFGSEEKRFLQAAVNRRSSRRVWFVGKVLAALSILVVLGWSALTWQRSDLVVSQATQLADGEIRGLVTLRATVGTHRDLAYEANEEALRLTEASKGQASDKAVLHHFMRLILMSPETPNAEAVERSLDLIVGNLDRLRSDDLEVIPDLLRLFSDQITPRLWKAATNESDEPNQRQSRLHAAVLLAQFDSGSSRWESQADFLLKDLFAERNLEKMAVCLRMIRPIKRAMTKSVERLWVEVISNAGLDSRTLCMITDEIIEGFPLVRLRLLLESEPVSFNHLYRFGDSDTRLIRQHCRDVLREGRGEGEVAKRTGEADLRRQVNATAILLRLGDDDDLMWEALASSRDNSQRTMLIHRLGKLGVRRDILEKHWVKAVKHTDRSRVAGLVLALGEYSIDLNRDTWIRDDLLPQLATLFQHDTDPGLHAAIEWLFVRWGVVDKVTSIKRMLCDSYGSLTGEERLRFLEKRKGWFVDSFGQTMVIIEGPREALVGSGVDEQSQFLSSIGRENRHWAALGRRYAIGQTEVPVTLFHEFIASLNPDEKRRIAGTILGEDEPAPEDIEECFRYDHAYSPTDEHPINGVIWYVAARFCNWMSEREGLAPSQWCYGPNDGIRPGMVLRHEWLGRLGYRMPTEPEWEYSARAGSQTVRHFGRSVEFADQYARFNTGIRETHKTLVLPAVLKPNDFGLFNSLGNCDEWTQSPFADWKDRNETEWMDEVVEEQHVGGEIVARGGSLVARDVYIRSSNRYTVNPNSLKMQNRNCLGLRMVRTLPTNAVHVNQ